jgi:hypothetical protein
MTNLSEYWKLRFEDQNNLIQEVHNLYIDSAYKKENPKDLEVFLEKLRDILDSEK